MLRKILANALHRLLLSSDAGMRLVSTRNLLADYQKHNEGRLLTMQNRLRLLEDATSFRKEAALNAEKRNHDLIAALQKEMIERAQSVEGRLQALEAQPKRKVKL